MHGELFCCEIFQETAGPRCRDASIGTRELFVEFCKLLTYNNHVGHDDHSKSSADNNYVQIWSGTGNMYAPDPKVTVTPSHDLRNGQQVTVSVTGFGSGGKFFISECASVSDANSTGCGHQLAAQPFGVTDDNGSGSYTFTVSTEAGVKPYNKARAQCTNQCVILATVGIGYGFAYAPIEFKVG